MSGCTIDARAVVRARVAPLFEKVRAVDVPVAQRRRLVVEEPDVDARAAPSRSASANLRSAGALKTGIAAENHEQLHGAGVDVLDQRAERRRSAATDPRRRIGDDDRRADVAERLIDRVREGVHGRRAAARRRPRRPLAACGRQILHRCADEAVDLFVAEPPARCRPATPASNARARSASTWLALSGSRWSAIDPVGVGVGSAT